MFCSGPYGVLCDNEYTLGLQLLLRINLEFAVADLRPVTTTGGSHKEPCATEISSSTDL